VVDSVTGLDDAAKPLLPKLLLEGAVRLALAPISPMPTRDTERKSNSVPRALLRTRMTTSSLNAMMAVVSTASITPALRSW